MGTGVSRGVQNGQAIQGSGQCIGDDAFEVYEAEIIGSLGWCVLTVTTPAPCSEPISPETNMEKA